MKSLQCLVILSACTCLSVSVGVRVPSAWDEAQGREGFRNYHGGVRSNNGFNPVNGQQRYNNGGFERRVLLENGQGNAELGTLYNTLQSNALNDFFGNPNQMLVLGQNGLYMFAQTNQGNAAVPSGTNQYRTELPPLRHPRYPQNPQLQISNHPNGHHESTADHSSKVPLIIGRNQYQQPQNIPFGPTQNQANQQYQTLPSNVLRIMPTSSGNINVNNNNFMGQSKLDEPMLKQFTQKYKPTIHKEYAQHPSMSYDTQIKVPAPSLKNYVSQEDTFIVSASTLSPIESDLNPSDELTTKKEPIFFVTEGYRNVLVQGPNKKKKYQTPQYQSREESKKVLSTDTLEKENDVEESNDEDERPPRKRKVTKIYKIHGNNEDRGTNAGGSGKNLVESGWERPKQFLKGPQVQTEDERKSGLVNRLTKNYRDDKIHEPIDDNDSEREDDDNDKIEDDEELEREEEKETEDVEDSDNEDNPKSENKDTNNAESDDNEESDEEDSESEEEEEPEQEVPHSEHADPKPVPTRPYYPGERAWAKPGVKHRPYVSQHRFIKPEETAQKPDGYDVFEDLEKYFENQKDQFGRTYGQKVDQSVKPVPNAQGLNSIPSIKSPNSVNPIVVYDPFKESSEKSLHTVPRNTVIANNQRIYDGVAENINIEQAAEEQPESNYENDTENEESEEEENLNKKEDFVPVQLYTQVRKSENEEHEPYDPLEHGRLREVIKDSKIQTVYTEEGYEDGAYDHAGHEKNAEQDQGHEEFEREKQERLKPDSKKDSDSDAGQSNKVFISDDPVEDSLPADSIYPSLPQENIVEHKEIQSIPNDKPKPSNNKNFITTQEVKTTQVKDKQNGDVQLEIQSEIKVIVQPNNSTKAHKYVKIYPKVLREFSKEVKQEEDDSNNDEENEEKTLPTLTDPERSENKTVLTTKIHDESSNSDNNVNAQKKVAELTVTSAKPITESALPAKVSIKAFENEFGNVVSSEKPKVLVKVLDDEEALSKISDEFGKIGSQVQRKRRSIDTVNRDLEIDLGFIDKINHTFAPKKPDVVDVEKYPYYTMPDINENSPLRYAENMENIPVKRGGELSFYKMADQFGCPDLPQSIDPVPEHVKNADKDAEQSENDEDDDEEVDEEDEEEDDEGENEDESIDQKHPPTPKTPRIQLGDKIDCLRIRYFGENPLDSPFFKEETVGPVKSIFKELEHKSAEIQNVKNIDSPQETTQIVENINKVNEIFDKTEKKDERKFESEVKDKVYNALKDTEHTFSNSDLETTTVTSIKTENDNAESINRNVKIIKPISAKQLSENSHTIPTPSSLVTLITTPKYTIQFTPKNIYDQIRLLDHLPEEEDVTEISETLTKRTQPATIKKSARVQEEVTTEPARGAVPNEIDRIDGKEESSRRQPKILREQITSNRRIQEEDNPDAEALRRRKLRRRQPIYQIFDVNKFLPTTQFPIINHVRSTVLPKHKVISEVFYKDEIKPNEQLNVFADVLNNIKNSTNLETIPLQSASNFAEPDSVTISNLEEVQSYPNIRVKKYQKDSSSSQNLLDVNPLQHLLTTEKQFNARYPESYEEHHSSTNKNIVNLGFNNPDNFGYMDQNRRNKPKSINSEENTTPYSSFRNIKVDLKKNVRRRRKPTKGTTSTTFRTTTNINVPSQSTPSNHKPYVIDVIEDTKGVIGLVPPTKWQYKTIVEDSDARGTDEVSEKAYEYNTIPPTFITEPITGPAAVTELIEDDQPVRPMNMYYFLGLKPPLNQRPRSYSEFFGNQKLVNNNVRRRIANVGYGHIRLKRDAARTRYSDVSRNRGSQNENIEKETTPVDDIDDYVPHRPKNYHYDEKTGKIVYHSKPQEEKESEEEEEEYEEIQERPGVYLERAEDATHPSPKKVTTKPLLATATPPPAGQGLLDFVAKLKNNPSYQDIPDPTTPDPSSKTTTLETVTVDPKSTNPPEFLSILSKVKSDSSYKVIEDPKESKTRKSSTTTTPEPEYDDEEDDEEEEVEENIQNSPGGQSQQLSNIEIFDIGDYLPKIKTVSPKTSIDYSKYKTIERPHSRHNISSRYNSDEQTDVEEVVAVRRPVVMEERESIDRPVVIEERVAHDKEVKGAIEEPSTTQKTVQFRRGTRPTTQRTTAETAEPTESSATRRSANRRRPLPSGFRTTRRPTTTDITQSTEKVERVYPQNSQSDRTYSQTHDPAKRVYRRRPVRIRHTTERHEEDDEAVDKIMRRSLDFETDDVQNEFEEEFLGDQNTPETHEEVKEDILDIETKETDDKADDNTKEKESILKEDIEEKGILISVTDEKEIKSANSQKIEDPLDVDDIEEKEASESNQREIVDRTKKYVGVISRGNRKHRENLKKEQKLKEPKPEITQEKLEIENDEVVKDTNKAKDDVKKPSKIDDNQRVATENGNKKEDVEIIHSNYDKTKKHGGNYRRETGKEDAENVEEIIVNEQFNEKDEKLMDGTDVEILNTNFDKTKRHGGNYKAEEDVGSNKLESDKKTAELQQRGSTKIIRSKKARADNENYKNSKTGAIKETDALRQNEKSNNSINKKRRRRLRPTSTTTQSTKVIPRLTDVVPKPDHFYTDSELPKEINTLKNERTGVQLDSKELEQVTEEGDIIEVVEAPRRRTGGNRRSYINGKNTHKASDDGEVSESKNEDLVDSEVESEGKSVPTKKPVFIKDPSKRLYFYAPV